MKSLSLLVVTLIVRANIGLRARVLMDIPVFDASGSLISLPGGSMRAAVECGGRRSGSGAMSVRLRADLLRTDHAEQRSGGRKWRGWERGASGRLRMWRSTRRLGGSRRLLLLRREPVHVFERRAERPSAW